MIRTSVLLLLTVAMAARAQSSLAAKEAFSVDPSAGVYGVYGFTAFPGEAQALTFKTGGPAYAVKLGGTGAGGVTALSADPGSISLGGTPDCLIAGPGSTYWGAFYRLLQVRSSDYGLGPTDYGQTGHLTRDSSGNLRLAYYNGSNQIALAKVTSAPGISTAGTITIGQPSAASFSGKWLQSPPGSNLMYEFTEAYDQVRIADYGMVNPQLGTPYATPGIQRARLYWAGGTTTYVVTVAGSGISIIELGSTTAIPKGSFTVQLPSSASCSGCTLSDLEIAQQAFPGYPSGAIIAVFSNKNASSPPPALLALVDWSDIATLLSLSTRADVASPALLDTGGSGSNPTGGPPPSSPGIAVSASSGCSSAGAGGPGLLLGGLLLGGILLRRSRRSQSRRAEGVGPLTGLSW